MENENEKEEGGEDDLIRYIFFLRRWLAAGGRFYP